jgi:ElaB/YqjD/DUF883 family membrane-anchored ribosome-binding protein
MRSQKAIQNLTGEVRELLAVLETSPTPDIAHLRSRIQDTLDSAQRTLDRSTIRGRLGRYATSVDHYVTHYPRLGFLTGIAAGGAIVYLGSLFRSRE